MTDQLRDTADTAMTVTGDLVKALQGMLSVFHDGVVPDVYRGKPAAFDIATNKIAEARAALAKADSAAPVISSDAAAMKKINAIRHDIVRKQNISWSAHIYPLVEALNAAGYPGVVHEALTPQTALATMGHP